MENSIYSFDSYKKYVSHRIRSAPKAGHGMRKRMAQAMNCQLSYFSNVLNGDRHLSVEQSERLCRFMGLDDSETEFFIWNVERERSGSPGARHLFSKLIASKQASYLKLKDRVAIQSELDNVAKATYYSSYLYGLVHMLVTIPQYQSEQAIIEHLKLEPERVRNVLKFLLRVGLVKEEGDKLTPENEYLFLEKSSPFIHQHHNNWRLRAMQSIGENRPEDLHLSLAVSLSHKDVERLKQKISRFIEEVSQDIKGSKEETVRALNIDFFTP